MIIITYKLENNTTKIIWTLNKFETPNYFNIPWKNHNKNILYHHLNIAFLQKFKGKNMFCFPGAALLFVCK